MSVSKPKYILWYSQNRCYYILFRSRWLPRRFTLHWNEQVQFESDYNISSYILFRPVIWQFPWMSSKGFIRLNDKLKDCRIKIHFKQACISFYPNITLVSNVPFHYSLLLSIISLVRMCLSVRIKVMTFSTS